MTTHFRAFDTRSEQAVPSGLYARHAKRILDLLLVAIMLPVAVPLILLLAILISLDGRSPFYFQHRVGRGGRLFRLIKLRSMVPDADARLARHLENDSGARAEWAHAQKLRDDPRVTAIGRFLRRTSLDELPQIWNVIRGEMSLVGPRPMMPDQQHLYPGNAYYALRPGITGPWQVSDRNQCGFAERARYDAIYLDRLSFLGDLGVLARTAVVVLRCTGI